MPEVGGFTEVRTLVNESAAIVRKGIGSFFASTSSRDDLLLLYFSGHGVKNARGELYLAVADTETDLLGATAIPASYKSEEMDGCASRRLVLVLDCCHSGAFLRGAKAAVGVSVDTRKAFEGTGAGRIILTATDSIQYAWEGDEVSGQAQSSVFTHFMVDGLRTGAADGDSDGEITVDELYDYVHAKVVARTPTQKPRKFAINQEGRLVIAIAPAKPVRLPPELQAAITSVFAGARLDAVSELDRWLHSGHVGRRLAAEQALRKLAQDDSRQVATAASTALRATSDVAAVPAKQTDEQADTGLDAAVSMRAEDAASLDAHGPPDSSKPSTHEDRVPRWLALRPGPRAIGIVASVVFALVVIWPLGVSRNQFDVGVVGLVVGGAVGLVGASLLMAGSRTGRALAVVGLAVIAVRSVAAAVYGLVSGQTSAASAGLLGLGALAIVAVSLGATVVLAGPSARPTESRTLGRRSIALGVIAGCLAITPGTYAYIAHAPPAPVRLEPSQRNEAPLPERLQEATAVAAGRKLYIIGGVYESGPPSSNKTFVFDGSWHAGPGLPIGLDHASSAAVGSTVFVAGGFIDLGNATARAFRLDGDRWRELAPMHHARGAAALVATSGLLLLIGGSTIHNAERVDAQGSQGEQVAPVEAYDPEADVWSDVSTLYRPRNHLAGFSYGRQACVAGGRSPEVTAAIDCYDPVTRRWSTPLPTLPTPTSGAGAGIVDSEPILAGGETVTKRAEIEPCASRLVGFCYQDQVMRFRGGVWRVEPMLVPRHAVSLAPYGGRLWACGGALGVGTVRPVNNCTSIGG
jgi:hypothetical protein